MRTVVAAPVSDLELTDFYEKTGFSNFRTKIKK